MKRVHVARLVGTALLSGLLTTLLPTAVYAATDCTKVLGNLIRNCGFETPDVGTTYVYFAPTSKAPAPWVFNNMAISANGTDFTGGNPPAPQGVQVAALQEQFSFQQQLTLAAGKYQLTFDAAQRSGYQPQDFNVMLDAKVLGHYTANTPAYKTFEATFVAKAGSYTVSFVGVDTIGGDVTAFIDNILLVRSGGPGSAPTPGNTGALVQPLNPASGADVPANGTVLFTWKPFPNATGYDLNIWLAATAPGVASSSSTTFGFSSSVHRLTSYRWNNQGYLPGIYRYSIAPYDAKGSLLANWSTPVQITISQ